MQLHVYFLWKNDALFPVQWKLQFDVTTIGFWLNAEIWLKQRQFPLYLVLPYVTDYVFKLQKWIKFHGFPKLDSLGVDCLLLLTKMLGKQFKSKQQTFGIISGENWLS